MRIYIHGARLRYIYTKSYVDISLPDAPVTLPLCRRVGENRESNPELPLHEAYRVILRCRQDEKLTFSADTAGNYSLQYEHGTIISTHRYMHGKDSTFASRVSFVAQMRKKESTKSDRKDRDRQRECSGICPSPPLRPPRPPPHPLPTQ